MNNKLLVWWMTFVALFLVSCKSKKGLPPQSNLETQTEVTSKNDTRSLVLNRVVSNANGFGYYSANGEVEYTEGDKRQELGITIVMEKDQYVLMNITAIMGIAVARVLATNDSLVILDMLHRKAIITNYQYLKKYTGVELKLEQLQNLFAGNALFATDTQTAVADTLDNRLRISQSIGDGLTQSIQYGESLKAVQANLYHPKKQQQLDITYRDPHAHEANLFPATIDINIKAEKKIESAFHLKTFVFEKKKDLQFSIPKSYEIVRL